MDNFLILLCVFGIFFSQLFSKTAVGLSEFGLNLQWGRALECTYIVRLYNWNIDHCSKECAARPGCRSFNYNVRSRRCELCPVDRQTGGFSRSPGVVYSEKTSWTQADVVRSDNCECTIGTACELQETPTACTIGTSCDPQETPTGCKIKECPMRPWEDLGVTQHGNMQAVDNALVFTCAGDALDQPSVTSVALTCDVNTGNWTSGSIKCPPKVYLGCFEDRPERTIRHGPLYISQTTSDNCRQACERDYYPNKTTFYFGTEIGSQCFCGDRYPLYDRKPEWECNVTCQGDQSERCGGPWRLSASMFQYSPIEL